MAQDDKPGMRVRALPLLQAKIRGAKNLAGRGSGRNPEHTPMLWAATANVGAITGIIRLPAAKDFAMITTNHATRHTNHGRTKAW